MVLVQPQPQPVTTTVYARNNSNYAMGAIIFAVAITICLVSCGCWYAIICSGIGIALAASVSDVHTMQQTHNLVHVYAILEQVVCKFGASSNCSLRPRERKKQLIFGCYLYNLS